MSDTQLTADALAIWKAGVEAVDARRSVASIVRLTDDSLQIADLTFDRSEIERVIVVGAGKASGWMAAGFEDSVDEAFLDQSVTGWVSVPDDQEITLRSVKVVGCRPAAENLPGERVLAGTERILDFVRGAGPKDLVVFMVAGGGSALLEKPVAPVTLEDFRLVTSMLSARGANIHQLNSVRRAISQVKAGGLARASNAGTLVALIVSDVIGDPLEVIASGPTVISDAEDLRPLDVLQQFDPSLESTPANVLEVLRRNDASEASPSGTAICTIHNRVLCNNETAVAAARQKAVELGYGCEAARTDAAHESAEAVGERAAAEVMKLALQSGRQCWISGGEPVVTLGADPGSGGRNQHLVLAAAIQLVQAQKSSGADLGAAGDFCLLSGGTDGEDGNVPVAGAWISRALVTRLATENALPKLGQALAGHDSYSVWQRYGSLVRVPPTRTNVCDLRVIVTDCDNS